MPLLLLLLSLLLTACGRNMFDQPHLRPQQASPFFADGSGSRPLIEGTVTRERGGIDPAFLTGQGPEGLLTDLPIPVSVELLQRGQERYAIYCAPCHGYTGDGRGVIVERGFPQPASFHEPRLQQSPVGYFFNAMTNGFGRMYPYDRIPPEDRWAIAGYIRALQLSRNATPADVPEGADLAAVGQGGVR